MTAGRAAEATGISRRGVMIMAAGAASMLGGCGYLWGSRYRFRMTVEIETPKGLRTGSSVMEVYAAKTPGPHLAEGAKADVALKGEAVVVDLPGGPLFALLSTASEHSIEYVATKTLVPEFTGGADGFTSTVPKLAARSMRGRSGEVERRYWPKLVRFRDVTDPTSIEAVDADNLANSFGPGVKLHRITVTVTDEALTTGIRQRLPYGRAGNGFNSWSRTLSLSDPRRVGPDHFYKGE